MAMTIRISYYFTCFDGSENTGDRPLAEGDVRINDESLVADGETNNLDLRRCWVLGVLFVWKRKDEKCNFFSGLQRSMGISEGS